MTTVTRQYHWSMGHRLQRHQGRCFWPHGHNYIAEVTVYGNVDDTGMVMDFSDLDALVKGVIDKWDHAFMVEYDDPFLQALATLQPSRICEVEAAPTAENIAKWIGTSLDLPAGVQPVCVKVWETPKSMATWSWRVVTEAPK